MVRKKRIKESDEESFYSSDSERSRSPLKEERGRSPQKGGQSRASSRSVSANSYQEETVELQATPRERELTRLLEAADEDRRFLRAQVRSLSTTIEALRNDVGELRALLCKSNPPQPSMPNTTSLNEEAGKPREEEEKPQEEMDTTEPSNKRTRKDEEEIQEPEKKKEKKRKAPAPGKSADEDAQPSESSAPPVKDQQPKIPPIVIRQREKWSEISRKLSDRRIQYTKAKLISEGIQVQPATVEAFRATTKMLTELKYEYHTYALPEERTLRAVIRGIPEGVSNDDIKEDLVDQGFRVESVQRMTSRRTKKTMPLALIKLPMDQVSIFQVTRCCALVVKVERQREAQQVTQCHRCQRFGHGQSKCTAQAKCVKCGAAHSTHECKKTRETPAKCANCQGAHPANYRGCPSCPKPAAKKTTTTETSQKKQANRTATTGRSFADAAKTGKCPPTANPSLTAARGSEELTMANLTAALAQMQQMYSAMSAFFAKMPTTMTA